MTGATAESICAAVADLADTWRDQRSDRQLRRHLDPADFAALRSCGLPLMAGPVERGGTRVPPPQRRRHVAPADFAALRSCGLPLMAVPVEQGGTWVDVATSTRPIAEPLPALARGAPCVARV